MSVLVLLGGTAGFWVTVLSLALSNFLTALAVTGGGALGLDLGNI